MKFFVLLTSILVSVNYSYAEVSILKKDKVVDAIGWKGIVTKVYSDGRAEVKYNLKNFSQLLETETLGKKTKCYENICVGDTIISRFGDKGVVIEVYTNGITFIDSNPRMPMHIEDFSKELLEP